MLRFILRKSTTAVALTFTPTPTNPLAIVPPPPPFHRRLRLPPVLLCRIFDHGEHRPRLGPLHAVALILLCQQHVALLGHGARLPRCSRRVSIDGLALGVGLVGGGGDPLGELDARQARELARAFCASARCMKRTMIAALAAAQTARRRFWCAATAMRLAWV
jgi:hypothetical protein